MSITERCSGQGCNRKRVGHYLVTYQDGSVVQRVLCSTCVARLKALLGGRPVLVDWAYYRDRGATI